MCSQCGMSGTEAPKYHPYAACLMFRGVGDGRTVDANLRAVVEYGMTVQKHGISLDEAMSNLSAVVVAALADD